MKSLSLARVLPVLENFESQRADVPRLDHLRVDAPRPDLHVVPQDEPALSGFDLAAPDPSQDHWQEGYEAGVAVGRAQAQAEMADQDLLLRDAVAAARAEWLAQESERIALGVEKALGVIEAEISDVASRILARIAEAKIAERALGEFTDHVRALLRDGEAGVVTVHAPEDLLSRLRSRLGSIGSLEFAPHDSAEIWVRSGATRIEARLGAWSAALFVEA